MKYRPELLPRAIPDGEKFAGSVLQEYLHKTQAKLPEKYLGDPKAATAWAKQNLRGAVGVIGNCFFGRCGSTCRAVGPVVLKIFEAAYSTNLGSNQSNNTLLLDEESRQLEQDCAARVDPDQPRGPGARSCRRSGHDRFLKSAFTS